ncbi:rho guanine nucleotide exchange factor 12 isoform X2 [Aethina tumida]|uniref:rho guanine nucleotide exchange factor 12 isoform X2 n=1 Tax=Aethina tumida TaxID=116153 RepID=UPI002148E9D7|nr:rho guanine nucleotide exchange factor 12 isoform X2 [Aethina tumida]
MDNGTPPALPERNPVPPSSLNGSGGGGHHHGRRPSPSPGPPSSPIHRPTSVMDSPVSPSGGGPFSYPMVEVVVNRDDKGYGMKVSGDNPVYVQSVKEGGAAEKAGLHAGDKIIKVNGVNVKSSTHTQVVQLIRERSQVVLTVQQRTPLRHSQGSSMHNRLATTPITYPQPVDNEKQCQLHKEKEQYYRLMIEKEKHWVDVLRSQIAVNPDEKKIGELAKTEKNIETLETHLKSLNESPPAHHHLQHHPHQRVPHTPSPSSPVKRPWSTTPTSPNGNSSEPPPLPKRNQNMQKRPKDHHRHFNTVPAAGGSRSHHRGGGSTPASPLDEDDINANRATPLASRRRNTAHRSDATPPGESIPPPLPPRTGLPPPHGLDPDACNSINKQMSYPLVATFATLVNDYSPHLNPTHHRTKSSPESLLTLSGAEASKKLIASESMNDLTGGAWERADTPPGTPPPPYPSPLPGRRTTDKTTDEGFTLIENTVDGSPDFVGFRQPISRTLANSSPIHAANTQLAQQPIISMEDDEISDLELNQVEDHGHFKSLSRLWDHLPHLAVFMNYVLLNSDPNSLLFYLLTDLYKEGNAKEMRKWAFEIHSCFLVPGAPLRLGNVDENIAREIDEVLTREYDKEEILRKIFWRARSRAKEELTKQLADFQQKRTAGLGTIFGPTDQTLAELYNDRSKEIKLYENLFLDKLEPYLEEIEKDSYDAVRYYTAAALATVLTRVFQIRPPSHAYEKCPTFVNKEKTFSRFQFLGKYSKKWNILNHQFLAQNYYTVIHCYHCQQIIYGIGPQGYQCSVCHIHLHRHCVKQYDDTCPGPVTKKDKFKFIRMRQENNDNKRKQSTIFLQAERVNRQMEERESSVDHQENESNRTGQPVSRSGSDRRPDAVREERHQLESASGAGGDPMNDSLIATKEDCLTPESSEKTHVPKKKSTNVSRSESVKEQPEKRKQRRNYSDPSHNNTPSGDVDHDTPPQAGFSNPDSSSSSSTSICNGRLSESPSNSVDTVGTRLHNRTDSDSDTGFESDIPQWQALVPEEQRKNLDPQEQKRQDIINEIFATENSHVRNLRVLHKIFYEKLRSSQVLKTDELHLIFPNIRDLFEVHNEFNRQMRRQREQDKVLVREVGELLLRMFEGERGDRLKTEAARFCEKQKYALELIKEKRKKDTKLENVLAECEKKRHCRRLQLQGILPIEMQRLSKYPLLLMRLIENTDKARTEELANLEKALRLCKEVANHVDEAVKLATNRQRLEEIQRHLDISNITRNDHPAVREFNLSATDLTKYTLIMEGSMQLRRPNKANVPIHVLLMEEAVFLLQREGDRYLLKFFQSGFGSNTQPLSPHIKTSLLLVRPNAVCKNGLYLVNTHTSNCQIYDLISEDDAQLDTWFKHFSDVVDRNNLKDGGKPKAPPASDLDDGGGGGGGQPESVQELPPAADVRPERAEQVAHDDKSAPEEDDDQSAKREDDEKSDGEKSADESGPKAPERGGGVEQLPKVTAEEWPLIQPSQVQVEVPPVHTAESMLTPLEQIRRKDIEVRKALEDKEHLVADLLNIPREDFQHIADMASSDVAGPREPTERLLAAIYQMGQLQKLINESLNVTESDAIAARGGKNAACASQQVQQSSYKPLLPVESVQSIVTTISQQFNALMSDVKHLEDERDLFRKENAKLRERLHEQCNLHGPAAESPTEAESSDNADDLANMEESLQKNEDGEVVEQ